jgi:predicted GNAT family N-acyltransferase
MLDVRRAAGRELDASLALRHAVFCDEQGVPEELERDGADGGAVHLAAVMADVGVVGTCRLLPGRPAWRLGRMAVARPWRGRGVGARLLRAAEEAAAAQGATEVALTAQVPVLGFYERLGYRGEGAPFEVAGIPHLAMRRALGQTTTAGSARRGTPPPE